MKLWINLGGAVVLAVGLLISGCQIDDGTGTPPSIEDQQDNRAPDEDIEEVAQEACGAFSREKLAKDLGAASTNPADIADAYADGFQDWARAAAFRGCLEGIQ